MIASLSAAIAKSPSTLTAVTFGSEGTVKCLPGGYACCIKDVLQRSASIEERRESDLGANARLRFQSLVVGNYPREFWVRRSSLTSNAVSGEKQMKQWNSSQRSSPTRCIPGKPIIAKFLTHPCPGTAQRHGSQNTARQVSRRFQVNGRANEPLLQSYPPDILTRPSE